MRRRVVVGVVAVEDDRLGDRHAEGGEGGGGGGGGEGGGEDGGDTQVEEAYTQVSATPPSLF